MATTTVIVATLVAYKLLLIGIGLWASRRTRSNADFFLGDRQLGPWVAAISYSASACSAWTLLGLSGAAFVLGISVFWLVLGALLGMVVAWLALAKPVQAASRSGNLLTLTDFISQGVTGAARSRLTRSVACIILFCFVFYIAAQFQGAGNAFAEVFALPATDAILIGAAIVLLYTWLGGFWAVSLTDTLQGLVMVFASVALPWVALQSLGGAGALWSGLSEVFTPEQMSLTRNAPWLTAGGVVIGGLAVAALVVARLAAAPRLQRCGDLLLVRVGPFSVERLPLDVVECFFLGSQPLDRRGSPTAGDEPAFRVGTLVVRVADDLKGVGA